MTTSSLDLISHARRPNDPATLAYAGIVGHALRTGRQPLIRGLSEARFQKLMNEYFLGVSLANGEPETASAACDEFDELVALLLEHRATPSEPGAWLAYAVATAATGENHLWQDMGLPSRKVLSALMQEHFPTLATKNTDDMKWKKFFYRQLCERAEVPVCKSPHCGECCDYAVCFGSEDA